jgi:hypothetical protein
MSDYLFSKIGEIDDEDILRMIKELQTITNVTPEPLDKTSMFHFLSQCIYPNGSSPSVPITKDDLDERDPLDAFLLRRKVRNLTSSSIYILCTETAQHFKEGIERHEGKSLYVFINHFFSVLKKKKPTSPKRRLFQ